MYKAKLGYLAIVFMTSLVFYCPKSAYAQPTADPSLKLSLHSAVMCETIEAYQPNNSGVVFSISNGKVTCYTSFDTVSRETVIYHNWYRKDQLSTSRQLTLKPPRWSAFTEIQLREADNGPWRVEILDETGRTIKTLRFSITE